MRAPARPGRGRAAAGAAPGVAARPGYLGREETGRMVHPGPRAAERVRAVRAQIEPVAGVLRAGETVMAGVARVFAEAGCRGGMVLLDGVTCAPLRYVLPALSTDGVHAAWYSDTHALENALILRATASVGTRDGAAFLHCHGLWQAGRAPVAMGHLLPFESVIATDAPVTGLGASDAGFVARPDDETAFTLFQPEGGGAGDSLVARIAPGEDVVTSIEALAAAHGITEARLHGLGSIDHVRFAQGGRMDCLATELRLHGAVLRAGRARVGIEVVDIAGRIKSGELKRGANPVGVTLELLIEPMEDRP